MSKFALLVIGSSTAIFLASGGYTLVPHELYDPACTIKGNISYNGGKKIYHMPGQEYYVETVITYSKGERWFCSEADARAAGWRKAGR
ncbi:hypothetical protein FP026_29725 [Rhizobium tropici]|uniref:Succinoglycan biosynthesis protein exoi n=1 Tax=Rhizobium tropici TaxID=398 RepID=A0A5B0VIR8_RHITR|nr:hypothetical protein [Rhizobium tropici]KAA1174630.1 hypothetical protein FP026_29725 [Rhizobium tropici]